MGIIHRQAAVDETRQRIHLLTNRELRHAWLMRTSNAPRKFVSCLNDLIDTHWHECEPTGPRGALFNWGRLVWQSIAAVRELPIHNQRLISPVTGAVVIGFRLGLNPSGSDATCQPCLALGHLAPMRCRRGSFGSFVTALKGTVPSNCAVRQGKEKKDAIEDSDMFTA